MKLREIIESVVRTESNQDWVDISELGQQLDVNISHVEQCDLKCYWVSKWYCTDTSVGMKVYFLKDEPVCASMQTARKNDENFYWISDDTFNKTRDYLLSLYKRENKCFYTLADLDEELGEGYNIYYCGQRFNDVHDIAIYQNMEVQVIGDAIPEDEKYVFINNRVIIKLPDETRITADIGDLIFPYITTKKESK